MHPIKIFATLMLLSCATISFAQKTPPAADSSKVDERVFTHVEVEAAFPGGQQAWVKFLTRNLHTDVPGKNGAPAGSYTTIVKFVVSKDGTLTNINTETKVGYGMEEEVVRVIEKSGKWIPALQSGRNVNAYRRQPITFLVTDENFDITTQTPYTLFIGVDNEISIDAHKVKPEDLQVTISKGKIKQTAEGKFVVQVTTPGRVTIELYNTKKDKVIGAASFEVVRVADK
jgi:hypothetical protein